jgi:DNA polymerase III delta prime subunit
LKILEEPPVGVVFIAVTALKEACLPTILSRFLEVPFRHLTSEEVAQLIKEQTYSEIIKKVISFNGTLEGLGQIENEALETFFENITHLKQLPEYAVIDLSKTIFEQKVYLYWLKSYLSYIQNATALKKLTHFSDSFFKNPLMIEVLFFEMVRQPA